MSFPRYPPSLRTHLPSSRLRDCRANRSLGKFITAAIHNRSTLLGARILGASQYLTAPQILAAITKVTGKQTKFLQVSADVYKSFLPGPVAQEFLENHLFIEEPGYYNGETLEASHAILREKLTTLEEYLTGIKVKF